MGHIAEEKVGGANSPQGKEKACLKSSEFYTSYSTKFFRW